MLEEFGLHHGISRVDIAVVNGRLLGYEIKSDRDTLARLPDQIRVYGAVLDKVTLVVGWRHVVAAMRLVPAWWGVSLVERGPRGGIRFSPLRVPEQNPTPDPQVLVSLLWRDEALALLEELGCAAGVRSKTKAAIYSRLMESVSDYGTLRTHVCTALKSRSNWRSAAQPATGGD